MVTIILNVPKAEFNLESSAKDSKIAIDCSKGRWYGTPHGSHLLQRNMHVPLENFGLEVRKVEGSTFELPCCCARLRASQ